MKNRFGLVSLILFFATLSLSAAPVPAPNPGQAQFKQLLADEWEYELRESPELATSIGDYRYNDHWSDSSLAHLQQQKKDIQE